MINKEEIQSIDVMNIQPMTHQLSAIESTIKYFSDSKNLRGKIIMPCGSGKTLTSFWILEGIRKQLKIRKIIITVPNLILQSQIFKTFYSQLSKTSKFICIGSDEDVTGDYLDEAIDVTTSEQNIMSFLNENINSEIIVVATYQSLNKLSHVCTKLDYEFDFSIIDEAHRTIGKKDKLFSTILFNDRIKVKKRLFMTATEKVYVGNEDNIVGMENINFYGKTIFNYSLSKAIKDDILCDYKVSTIYSTSKEVNNFIKLNSYLDFDIDLSEHEKENLICGLIATLVAIREKGCRKIVSYHSTIKKAKIFKLLLDKIIDNNLLNIGAYHINGVQNSKDKFDNILKFKNASISILTNSQALVEGVDIPCIDCIIFCDKRESAIGIIQAIGRSLRKFEGKKNSYIIIPILTNKVSDIYIENKIFKRLFKILMSISIMDERVLHEFKTININNYSENQKIIEHLIEIDDNFKKEIIKLIDEVHLKVWGKVEGFLPYEQAREWVIENLVPKGINTYLTYANNNHLLPYNIPKSPNSTYKDKGWINWMIWFGKPQYEILPYQEARQWVIENLIPIGIDTNEKWHKYKDKPYFIPKTPNNVYMNNGWVSWSEWFGKEKPRRVLNGLPYEEARKWVIENLIPIGIDSCTKFKEYIKNNKLPLNIPKSPSTVYEKKGWKGWMHYLGKGNGDKFRIDFLSYENAKKWINENLKPLGIDLQGKYKSYISGKHNFSIKINYNLPYDAKHHYKDKGWIDWNDYLSSDILDTKYEDYKKWIVDNIIPLGINTRPAFKNYLQKQDEYNIKYPKHFPRSPHHYYTKKGEWKGYYDLFEVKYRTNKKSVEFNEFKKFVQEKLVPLGIDTHSKYIQWYHGKIKNAPHRPLGFPMSFNSIYTKEYKGADDLFNKSKVNIPFNEYKQWVQENLVPFGINTSRRFHKYKKGEIKNTPVFPKNFSKSPLTTYKGKGWISYADLFQSKHHKNQFLSFEEAKKWIQENLEDKYISYRKYQTLKLPNFIPNNPDGIYKNKGYIGFYDFIGRKILSYEEVKEWANNHPLTKNIKSSEEWKKLKTSELPAFIPKDIGNYFTKKGTWKGWGDFLGTGTKHRGDFLNYEDAKKWVQKNELTKNINSSTEWDKIKYKLPYFIPKSTANYYINKGAWKGWNDFLNKN